MAGHAATRRNDNGSVRCGSWCHGLLWGEPADEEQPPLMTVRTDPRLDRRHRLHAGWHERWSGRAVLCQVDLGRRLELKHLPHPGGVMALCGMPWAKITDFVGAARQHVLEEATHGVVAAKSTGSPEAGLTLPALDVDRFVVETDDAGVGESDTKDVASEIAEHSLFDVAPGGDVENLRLGLCGTCASAHSGRPSIMHMVRRVTPSGWQPHHHE